MMKNKTFKTKNEETVEKDEEEGSTVDVKVEASEEDQQDGATTKSDVKAKASKSPVKTEVKKESKEDLQSEGERLMKEIGKEYGASLRVPGHKWSSAVPDVCLTEECILGKTSAFSARVERGSELLRCFAPRSKLNHDQHSRHRRSWSWAGFGSDGVRHLLHSALSGVKAQRHGLYGL